MAKAIIVRWRARFAVIDSGLGGNWCGCTGSRNILGEQFGQSDKVVGGHCKGELPVDLGQPAMPQLT
jgi:hypothetical protein